MARSILRLSNLFDRWVQVLSATFLIALVGFVMLQVVARYVFQSPPSWTEELARYAMIWAGLLGATMSFKRRFDPALFVGANTERRSLALAQSMVQGATVIIYLAPILWYCLFGPGMRATRGFLYRHANIMAESIEFPTVLVAISVPLSIVTIMIHLLARWAGDETRYEHT